MPRSFTEIAFTPSVKAAQERYGSRKGYEAFEGKEGLARSLGAGEAAFIAGRDSFYQATVGESGWPYVQFKGGARGFLKVLDERTLGYADFRGNRQYLSLGNLAENDRVALILVDYPNRRRLKIWARARLVEKDEDPALLARLEEPGYKARTDRAVIFTLEALDWNCPQHITPRFTAAEIEGALLRKLEETARPLRRRIRELEDELAAARRAVTTQPAD